MDQRPSPTELTVLKRLWRTAPLSAREIHDGVQDALGWSYSSTRKTLERMEDKGLVAASEAHGLKVYRPAADKVSTLGRLMRDFAANVLELDAPMPVTAFSGSPLLDESDIEDLERFLESESDPDRAGGEEAQ